MKIKARRSFVLLVFALASAASALGQEAGGRGVHRVSWPGKDWALDVTLPNPDVAMDEYSDVDATYWFMAFLGEVNNPKQPPPMLEIRLRAAKVARNDTELRDSEVLDLKKRGAIDPASVQLSAYKGIPVAKYTMEIATIASNSGQTYPPAPPTHRINAFFVRDGVRITLSAMKPSLNREDEKLFYSVLDSVKFTDTVNPSTSFDYYFKAKSLIAQKQHKRAAEYLNTAIELERKQRRLSDENWRNLILQLVDLHTGAGDRARAKELLEYGVSVQPTTPLFHLALAKHYAALDDVDNTIASLEKTYLYRKNDLRTASWFEPLRHPAFERFKKNEKFRQAIQALKR